MTAFPVEARWIWSGEHDPREINAQFEFRRDFECTKDGSARVAITADSRYRLFLNGEWIGDGPPRGYPDAPFWDDWSVTLRSGSNRLEVTVLYFGVDTFQSVRSQPGLLAAVVMEGKPIIASTADWQVRRAHGWMRRVPRISCQQGFEEHFDARVAGDEWKPAFFSERSHRRLERRSTPLPAREWREGFRLLREEAVRPAAGIRTISVRRHFAPFGDGINLHGMAGVLTASLVCREAAEVELMLLGPVAGVFVDGVPAGIRHDQDLRSATLRLAPGRHALALAICTEYDHGTELAVGYHSEAEVEWLNWKSSGPLWSTDRESNCCLGQADFEPPFGGEFLRAKEALWERVTALAPRPDDGAFAELPAEVLCEADAYAAVRFDRAEPGASDFRRVFDAEELTAGCFEMEIEAEAGTIVDAYFFEHEQEGKFQYLHQHDGISYRNSFRYVAREGRQTFTSGQRRGFRYVVLVARQGAIHFHRFGVWESLWQPEQIAYFESSDAMLNRIHAISQRTLRLCMEDTFTDCPSYEQVFWIGDARNEALFAQWTFGASDLTRHSLRLAAQSLDRLPLVASQCPSGWDILIPAFSFLWSVAVWDAYWHTGDRDFLLEMAAPMRKNLLTALAYCTDHGLFRARAWNFFDWTEIDQNRETVLHNSQLLVLALGAGLRMSRALGEEAFAKTCEQEIEKLSEAIERLWDEEAGCYRDALREDGSRSEHCCQHTSFLALLRGENEPRRRARLLANCLTPPPGMTLTGSPNAMFFLLEALGKEGKSDEAMRILRNYWGRMVEAGATTFWEMINPEGSEFPTRSHCHGWSSSPVYLLPWLLFGIECLEPGWRKVRLRPRSFGFEFVRTAVCTPHGLLHLEGKMSSSGTWVVTWSAPESVNVVIHHANE